MIALVLGGASSGKSEVAEEMCMALPGKRAYVATMRPFGEEARRRIERHARLRAGKGMATIERYTDIAGVAGEAAAYGVLLVECMANLVANEQFRPDALPGADVAAKAFGDVLALAAACPNVVVVTCDVFRGGSGYPRETVGYMRNLGALNRMLAAAADRVVEVFYGLPVELKREARR